MEAMLSDRAVHAGVDNQGVVGGASRRDRRSIEVQNAVCDPRCTAPWPSCNATYLAHYTLGAISDRRVALGRICVAPHARLSEPVTPRSPHCAPRDALDASTRSCDVRSRSCLSVTTRA